MMNAGPYIYYLFTINCKLYSPILSFIAFFFFYQFNLFLEIAWKWLNIISKCLLLPCQNQQTSSMIKGRNYKHDKGKNSLVNQLSYYAIYRYTWTTVPKYFITYPSLLCTSLSSILRVFETCRLCLTIWPSNLTHSTTTN